MKARLYILIVITILMSAGCDGVYSTKQNVSLKVIDRLTDEPAIAAISLSRSRERLKGQADDDRSVSRGATGAEGLATLDVDTTVIVGGLFKNSKFGAFTGKFDDRVSGYQFFVKARGPSSEEILELTMKPGERIEGKMFIVEVVSIGETQER